MNTINTYIWAAGLVLQAVLFALLWLRRLPRRAVVFTFLIGFYIVRSTVLKLLPLQGRGLYDGLALLDLCLQLLLVAELTIRAFRSRWQWTWPNRAKFAGLVVSGIAVAWGVAIALTAPGRVPVDRGAVFVSVLMMLLLLAMMVTAVSGLPRRIAEGFAFYGLVGIAAAVGRNHAALHANASAYATWAYIQAGTYLVVVLYWLLTLRPDSRMLSGGRPKSRRRSARTERARFSRAN